MKNYRHSKYFISILSLLFLAVSSVTASESELESHLQETRSALASQRQAIDSLNVELNRYAARIDQEKAKPKPNRMKLEKLMARALTVSDQIDIEEKRSTELDHRRRELEADLEKFYTTIIDSLSELKASEQYESDSERLEKQMLTYAEKRLRVAPLATSLSFDPQRILKIRMADASDSLEKAIFVDYLTKAQTDIQTHHRRLKNARLELEEIVALRQRTDEFIAEANDDDDFGFFQIDSQSDENALQGEDLIDLGKTKFGPLGFYFQSIVAISDQLGKIDPAGLESEWIFPADSTAVNLSFEDYLELLSQVERQLSDYDLIISGKLDQAR